MSASDSGDFDVVVVGGGPAGATAATELTAAGRRVLLIDRNGRTKPCGGAVPPRLLKDFDIAPHLVSARIRAARLIAPSHHSVDMPIGEGYVGMVDRETFDVWLRQRAAQSGAFVEAGTFQSACRTDGRLAIRFRRQDGTDAVVTARALIGADGANSAVRRQLFGEAAKPPYVVAYHEIVRAPRGGTASVDPQRCNVYYQARISPDFYGWVFPHGDTISVGTGSAVKGFDLREATRVLREASGLVDAETLRREGAPLPLKPLRRWDNGRDTLLAGDAAGVVAPSSGEGIYYAMLGGRLAADAAGAFLTSGHASALASARRRFMRDNGQVFLVLGFMQWFWYRSDKRRERFVAICEDADVQRLVWESYLTKRLVRSDPLAHLRVVLKDLRHVWRLAFD